jgi:hypothetical protein
MWYAIILIGLIVYIITRKDDDKKESKEYKHWYYRR